jgi:hypothetical protein
MSNFLKIVSGRAAGTAMVLGDLPSIANSTILGNNSGGATTPSALTVAQVLTLLGIRAGNTAISNGASSVSVTFSTAFANTSYAITCNLLNTTDTNPTFQPVDITAQSTTGFTAKINGPVPTGNYSLSWTAIVNN